MTKTSAQFIRAFLFITIAAGLCGCASIVCGTHQRVRITSTPEAAKVHIERMTLDQNISEFDGTTPTQVSLSRKGSYLVTVSAPGYEKAEIPISNSEMNGWIWGNIAFGGLVGLIIDSADGAAMSLKPDEINVQLQEIRTSSLEQPQLYAVIYTGQPGGKTLARAFPLQSALSN